MSKATAGSAEQGIKALLSGDVARVADEPDVGPFADDADFLRTLEALMTLQGTAYKLTLECQQRVLSFASRDFGDATATGVQRAMDQLPLVRHWVERLRTRLDTRGALPLVSNGMRPRFVRTCEVYEFNEVEQRIFAALLMIRATHAFAVIKLGSSMGCALTPPRPHTRRHRAGVLKMAPAHADARALASRSSRWRRRRVLEQLEAWRDSLYCDRRIAL